jgi:branched-chain amino acid transport system substrate-binding protein
VTEEAPCNRSGASVPEPRLDRRRFLRAAGLTGAAAGLSGILGACSLVRASAPSGRPIRLGMIVPQTGALAGFGEATSVVITGLRRTLGDGLKIGGQVHPIQLVVRDSSSDVQRSAQVTRDLIEQGDLDLLMSFSAPGLVADIAERSGVPTLSSGVPWEPWFYARPGQDLAHLHPFKWTYHFMWGMQDIIRVYQDIWRQVPTNKVVGTLFPQGPVGAAWAHPRFGIPGGFTGQGYTFVHRHQFHNLSNPADFHPLVADFIAADAQVLTGIPTPADFATFWKVARTWTDARGRPNPYRPKLAAVAQALLFPAFIEVLRPSASGLCSEVWWHPSYPYRSSLTGQSAEELARDYTKLSGRQWTQPIGPLHALFEVALDVLRRAGPGDRQAVAEALAATDLRTIAGRLTWGNVQRVPSPAARNVATSPAAGGQWLATRAGSPFAFDLVLVANPGHPEIPVHHQVQPLA